MKTTTKIKDKSYERGLGVDDRLAKRLAEQIKGRKDVDVAVDEVLQPYQDMKAKVDEYLADALFSVSDAYIIQRACREGLGDDEVAKLCWTELLEGVKEMLGY